MRIRAGCELSFEFSQTMPMSVTLQDGYVAGNGG